jgi:HlyD family secretion protein
MKARKIIAPLILLIIAAAAFYYFYFLRSSGDTSDLITSGHIEVTEVDLSFRLPGHISRLLVEEGDEVKKGDLVAELDPEVLQAKRDQAYAWVKELEARRDSLNLSIKIKEAVLEAEVNKAKAGVSAAEARYQSLKRGSRTEEIREAAAAVEKAKTEYKNRQDDFLRMKQLYENKLISTSQYEASRTAANVAKAAVEAAEERYKLVKAGPREETVLEGEANLSGSGAALKVAEASRQDVDRMKLDLKALDAQIDQAKAMLAVAEDDLAKTHLLAPFDGFVTVKDVEEDEYVQPGTPVVTVARLDPVWVKTYVPETQIGRIRLGEKAEVITDSFPDKAYPGKITFISPEAEFTPKNVQTKEERVKLVYRIKVTLENPNQELKAGMPVDVIIR